jgi:organic hydroperoxide reductase OsmC/OhrA
MPRVHTYDVGVTWTGNRGSGTSSYHDYDRIHEVTASGRPSIQGSSDAAFRGDGDRWNPELLLLAALSECHMLWYLHLAATTGVVVTAYADAATATMHEHDDGGGEITLVVLHPTVDVADGAMVEAAVALHEEANQLCFIARSVVFPVHHEPVVNFSPPPQDQAE